MAIKGKKTTTQTATKKSEVKEPQNQVMNNVNDKIVDDKIKEENEALKKSLELMQQQIDSLAKMVSNNQSQQNNFNYDALDVPLNKIIKVMSLFDGRLILSTQPHGGKTFRFNGIGATQPIIYQDLVQILSNHPRLVNEGYFIVLDDNVIKAHGLTEVYNKILNVEQVKNILEYDNKTIESLFTKTTRVIKESIISVITDKIKNKESVDKNKVHLIGDLCGMDLFAYARGDVDVLVNSKNNG